VAGVGSIRAVLTLTPVLVAGAFPIAGPIDSARRLGSRTIIPGAMTKYVNEVLKRHRRVASK
jgi:hypothetical protein